MARHVIASASIVINAPAESVWNILTDFDRWPEWQKGVSTARLEGPLAPGSVIHWKGGGMNIASTLASVAAPHSIVWNGVALGMRAHHSWKLEATGSGTTISSEDALSGWLVSLITFFKPGFFQKTLETTLKELKAEAEKHGL